MRMRGVQRQVPRQEMHRALWSTYLAFAEDVAGGPQSLRGALDALRSLWTEMPSALPAVGTALWNLVGAYQKKEPPAEFVDLLRDVLGLEVDRARDLRNDPAHADFPPFPRPMIRDSWFAASPQGTQVALTLRVEANFDTMSLLADPEEWPRLCPLFWADVKRAGSGWDAEWHPPAMESGRPLAVRLEEESRTVNPTEASAVIRVLPDGGFGEARLVLQMQPEPEMPGWTRIAHERDVTFGPYVPRAYWRGTVAYWAKSEIACLALQ